MNCCCHSFIVSLFLGITAIPAAASALTLPEAIDRLESDKTAEVCAALDEMSRICDESCLPYVADMMGHHEPEVAIAACKAAQSLANPRLMPPLLNLVRNHPNDEVRLEALNALTRLENGYETLLMYLDPENPDELQRRILRSLPEDLLEPYAPQFARYAGIHGFSTSVAFAYRKQPQILVRAILNELHRANKIERHNLLRTMTFCADALKDIELSPQQQSLFWDNPVSEMEYIAMIQAYRSTPDAIRWLLTWAKQIPADVWYGVLEAIHGPHAESLTDALLKDDTLGFSYHDVALSPAMRQAFLKHLPQTPEGKALALEALERDETSAAALGVIHKFRSDAQIREIILKNLGNPHPNIAITAMHLAAQSPDTFAALADLILNHSNQDNMGRVYLARWAILLMVSNFPQQTWPNLDALHREALQTAAQSRRLHAEPALELCRRLGKMPSAPAESEFIHMRPDMKRAWIRGLDAQTAAPLLRHALSDEDAAVRSESLHFLINHPEAAQNLDETELDTALRRSLEDRDLAVRIAGATAAGTLARTTLIPELQNLLTHVDIRVAYSALWGLQKMYALPNEAWLKALYYRAPDGVLRERLGFLSGYAENNREFFPMAELESQKRLTPGQIIQILSKDEYHAGQDIAIILNDQSIRLCRTNVFGMLFL